MNILVSCCLMGEPCRYDAASKPDPAIRALEQEGHVLIPVCPEVMGGLPTPRPPAECQPDGRVVNREGADVTAAYRIGAQIALGRAKEFGCPVAILKAKSPSCGNEEIYDGSFSRRLIPGMGVAARMLTEAGIRVLNETQLDQL